MANKLSRALGNIETALQELAAEGHLKAVYRRLLRWNEPQTPVACVKIVRYRREAGQVWVAEVAIQVVTRRGSAADDEANIDLAARVDGKLSALADSGLAQAALGTPVWDPWEHRASEADADIPVGSIGGLTMTVEEPLLL